MNNRVKSKRLVAFILAMACVMSGSMGMSQSSVYAEEGMSQYSENPDNDSLVEKEAGTEDSAQDTRENAAYEESLQGLQEMVSSETSNAFSRWDFYEEKDFAFTQESTTQAADLTQNATTQGTDTTQNTTTQNVAAQTTQQPLILDTVYNVSYSEPSANGVMLTFSSMQDTASGYYIYRHSKYDADYVKVGELVRTADMPFKEITYQDTTFVSGISFAYKVVPYHVQPDGQIVEGHASSELTVKKKLAAPKIQKVSRNTKTIKVTWKKTSGVSGYEIRYMTSRKWKKVVSQPAKTSASIKKDTTKSGVKVKMRGFVSYGGKRIYSDYSKVVTLYSTEEEQIRNKFKQLRKKYPSYSYWNHMGKSSYNSSTITNIPCQHNRYGLKYCNHYDCPDNIIGLQCYGFAWKMSDFIYGKNAKVKKHKSFEKAAVGDVVRYHGHSIIIVEKHKNYVVAGECNVGGTCMILWGRKVYKSELSNATYSHRTLK